ncbi:hypothetical protein GW931_02060 [archaeon]|nr:hypothetical protein [archaeon]PJC45227.1 MAG: hypothetical protein CO037_02605 [Candidatus Pacearchaeota archaeon CG_4_9_14_0_2_um_filter_30_8]
MELDTKNILKQGFSEFEMPKNHEITSSEGAFGEVGKSKIEALKKSISEIHEMIQGREKLSRKIHEEGENLKSEIKGYLSENEKMQIVSSDPTREKNDLRHKKIEISELQMNEKIGCWKDIALLKKELREYERELTEKEDRLKMFTKILGDEE